jgi:hypothetical protein
MPSIIASTYTSLALVRIEVNWADVSQATHATVWRVDCETGERTQLRSYVAYNANGYLLLSCGVGIFWDTEMPLDRCFYYCTTAQDAAGNETTAPAADLITDTFTRVVAGGWGTATSGQVWASANAGEFSVNGTQGLWNAAAANITRRMQIDGPLFNAGITALLYPTAVATGASFETGVMLRKDMTVATNTFYDAEIRWQTTGVADLRFVRSTSSLATLAGIFNYTATTVAAIRFEINGNTLMASAWDATGPEPPWPMLTFVDTSASAITAGGAPGVLFRTQAGNTNSPFSPRVDNVRVYDPCADLVEIENCTESNYMPSSGENLLRDPLTPCNDLRVSLCWVPDPSCVPARGIFFARMEDENYDSAGTNLNPVNARRAIPVIRERQDVDSTLVLVTRTFEDRDALLETLESGHVLLWQSPPEYGIPDRYINVGGVQVARYQNDHRYQPRVVSLPFQAVDRPEGPASGVCGTRVADLCDIHPAWDSMTTFGLSWADLLRGAASNTIPDLGERTWADVNTTWPDWNTVNSNNADWNDVLDVP